MSMLRTFTAIKLPNSLVQRIDTLVQRHLDVSPLRPVASNALHLTLNFVGDVEDREIPELCQEFLKAITGFPPFEIRLSGWGAFPNFARPRVFWIGVDRGAPELVQLNARLRNIIEEFGFVQEKKFLPHLTVARVQNRELSTAFVDRLKSAFEHRQWEPFLASDVIVYNSILEKTGPVYIPLSTIKLSGRTSKD